MNKIIFIGGIHGVGKTTLCNQICKKIDINHYSASNLIKRLNEDSIGEKSKNVADINRNQDKLITAIDSYINKKQTYLLDGHFCLFNLEKKITKIPEKVFKKINPSSIVVVYDNIQNIRYKNNNRDAINYDEKLLDDFQCQELIYSKHIAEKLKIPYMMFDVNTEIDKIIDFIKNSIKDKL
jgi:adenylate kinase